MIVLAALLCFPHAGGAQTVSIGGDVDRPSRLDVSDLEKLPATTVETAFQTGHGPEHHVWTGALLWDVLSLTGLRDAANARAKARHVISVKGRDGYVVALALGEVAPDLEGKTVVIAYRQDSDTTASRELRLVVPGDKHGARAVRDVVEVEVR